MTKDAPNIGTAKEVAEAYHLPSEYTVHELRRKRKIPALKLGYRTFRFDLDAVGAALRRLEIKAIA